MGALFYNQAISMYTVVQFHAQDRFLLQNSFVLSQHFVIFSYLKEKKIIIRPIYKISDSMETLLSILLPKTPKNVQIWQPQFSLRSDDGATLRERP